MKKYICLLLSVLFLSGCASWLTDEINESNRVLDEAIKDNASRIESLERKCSEMNTNLASLRTILEALQKNDYVKSVTPVEENGTVIGYTISFINSGDVTLYHGSDGKDAHNPQIGIKADSEDGHYYWTLDGEWLLDENGNRLMADAQDGVTPQLRITDDMWEVSYDGGMTWVSTSHPAVGEDGTSFFKAVDLSENFLDLVLSDDTAISVPVYKKIEIILDLPAEGAGIAAGKEIYIDYKLKGNLDKATVSASSDGHYKVRIESTLTDAGTLVVTCPETYSDGYVNLYVHDAYGYSSVKVVRFYESKMIFPEGLEYSVSSGGGTVNVPFSVNFDYTVKIDDSSMSWLTLEPASKAEMRDESISLTAGLNYDVIPRQAKVYIYAEGNDKVPYTEITINQASASFSIDKSTHVFAADGGRTSFEIESTMGLQVKMPGNVSWIRSAVEEREGDKYTLTVTAESNPANRERECHILLYSEDGEELMEEIKIRQLYENVQNLNDMVLTVRVNYVNDFTGYLPLAGKVDCYVDWGDGKVDYYNSEEGKISGYYHKYDAKEPASYEVRISGTVTELNSENLYSHSVIEVNHWGRLGLTSMRNAFCNNTMLKMIAEDTRDAFEGVSDFSRAFYGCLSLCEIPVGLFDSGKSITNCSEVFAATGIATVPELLLSNCENLVDVSGMFSNCLSFTSVPEELFRYSNKIETVSGLFCKCKSLKTLPGGLFSYTPEITNIDDICFACDSLESIPTDIFDYNLKLRSFNQSFMWCGKLSGESPYTVINGVKVHLYERINYPDYFLAPIVVSRAFEGTNLSDLEDMPTAWSSLSK